MQVLFNQCHSELLIHPGVHKASVPHSTLNLRTYESIVRVNEVCAKLRFISRPGQTETSKSNTMRAARAIRLIYNPISCALELKSLIRSNDLNLTRSAFRASKLVLRYHNTDVQAGKPVVTKADSVIVAATDIRVKSPPNAPRGALDAYELGDDEMADDLEEMFIDGPAGVEWGGPTRGGQRPEPTRYGDWERKGRTSDF